jgi:hypothetical protein
MKRNVLIFIMILFGLSVGAQQIKQQVISSAGGYNVSGGMSISWTLGETIIPTFQNGNLIITHGFQQQLIITTVEDNIEPLVTVTIYPNPSSDMINIQFVKPVDGEIRIFLLDSQGRLVKTDRIEETETNKKIDMQDLAAGIYYLRMTKGNRVNVYKVVKL